MRTSSRWVRISRLSQASPLWFAVAAAALLLATFGTPNAWAAWTSNGNRVTPSSFSGNTAHDSHVIADGNGGIYVVWSDDRNGDDDIWLQRLNSDGTVYSGWPAGGLDVCDVGNDQRYPRLALDGTSGVYVCWQDDRDANTGTDIFVQRITSGGAVASGWTANGIAVCDDSANQLTPDVCSDGNSGAIVVWEDHRSTFVNNYAYAQRINGSGTTQWTSDGVQVNNAALHLPPRLVSDGNNGAIVVLDLYYGLSAQRLQGSNGARLWPNGSPSLSGVSVNSSGIGPSIALKPGGGVYVAYEASNDIYYRSLSLTGTLGTEVTVCNATGNQAVPAISSDGHGGVIIAWLDFRAAGTARQIYAQRVNSDNTITDCWAANGEQIESDTSYDKTGLNVSNDGTGGAVLTWAHNGAIYARRIKADSNLDSRVTVSTEVGSRFQPSFVRAGSGSIIGAWTDYRVSSTWEIYANQMTFTVMSQPASGISDLSSPGGARYGVTLHWTGPSNDGTYGAVETFEIYRAGELVMSYGAGSPNSSYCVPIDSHPPCSSYNYYIVNVYDCGVRSTASNTAQATTECSGFTFAECNAPRRADPVIDMPAALELAMPNPVSGSFDLSFGIPSDQAGQPLDLAVFDVSGRRLRTLSRGAAEPGRLSLAWDLRGDAGQRIAPGMYFVRFVVGDQKRTRSLMVQ